MRKPKRTKQRLKIAIDFGTSGIKAAGSIDGGKDVHAIFVPPEIIEIDRSVAQQIEFYPNDCINGIWLRMGEKYFALGSLARDLMATTIISQAKSRFICEKTAAIVWLMAKHFNLTNQIDISMACLLPPGELREARLLQDLVASSLHQFEAPDGNYAARIDRVEYLPEGFGIYQIFKDWYGSASLQDLRIGVVMMGHRNTSFFTALNDRLGTFRSSEIGFWRIVQDLGLPITAQLAEGTAKWLSGNNDEVLGQILSNRGVVSQENNLQNLKDSIDKAKQTQVRGIVQWLSEIANNSPLDVVLVAGGAADSFKPELVQFFDRLLPDLPGSDTGEAGIFFHGGRRHDAIFPTDNRTRFMDISGVWHYFAD